MENTSVWYMDASKLESKTESRIRGSRYCSMLEVCVLENALIEAHAEHRSKSILSINSTYSSTILLA